MQEEAIYCFKWFGTFFQKGFCFSTGPKVLLVSKTLTIPWKLTYSFNKNFFVFSSITNVRNNRTSNRKLLRGKEKITNLKPENILNISSMKERKLDPSTDLKERPGMWKYRSVYYFWMCVGVYLCVCVCVFCSTHFHAKQRSLYFYTWLVTIIVSFLKNICFFLGMRELVWFCCLRHIFLQEPDIHFFMTIHWLWLWVGLYDTW